MKLSTCCLPSAEIKTVEHAFSAFAVEHHMNVVSHQRSAKDHRVRRQMGAAIQVGVESARVKRGATFALQAIIIGQRIRFADQFRDGITEISALFHADVALNDFSLAPRAEKNKRARMRNQRSGAGARNENQINRLRQTAPWTE